MKLQNEDNRAEYKKVVEEKWKALRTRNSSMEKQWTEIKEVLTSSAKDVLGKTKKPKEEWLSQTTLHLVDERRCSVIPSPKI